MLAGPNLRRAEDAIRSMRLRGPNDGPGEFTFPKDNENRRELADLLYEVSDRHAARAVLDAPTKHRITWTHTPKVTE